MSPAQPSTDSPPPQPRRFQFGLRSLLAITAIYGLAAFVARPFFAAADYWLLAALVFLLATPLALLAVVVPPAALWGSYMGCMCAGFALVILYAGLQRPLDADELLRPSLGIGLYTSGICGGVRAVRTPYSALGWIITLVLTGLFLFFCCLFSLFPPLRA